MIQAEIGGAARTDPGAGVQRSGYMIRDFALATSRGETIRSSNFRGRSNLVVVFPGYSDTMPVFLEDVARHICKFRDQDTAILVVLPHGPEERTFPIVNNSPIIVLSDKMHEVHRFSGAMDENGRPVPLVYLTDRFGEIISAYVKQGQSMPPGVGEILRTLEFVNYQCPECEPPEWPR